MRPQATITILIAAGLIACRAGGPTPLAPDQTAGDGDGSGSTFSWSNEESAAETYPDLRRPLPPPYGYKWHPDILEPHRRVIEEMFLTSENGVQIYVSVIRPMWSSADMPCHGLVLVPGGTQKGTVWHAPWRKSNTAHWAGAGFLVTIFDCQGRGNSDGEEDFNGPIHRGDLKTVIEYCASRPDVLPDGVGLVTSSWGCTLASGTLATYPDLPVHFYIDLEGAHDRYSATQYDDPFWVKIFGGHETSDDEFWSEREAITFQPFIEAPYIRVQSDMDHAFDYFHVDHAIDMVNAAVLGPSPHSRLNHGPANTELSVDDAETYYWEKIELIDEALYMYVVQASMTKF